jgi:hypothetical protein
MAVPVRQAAGQRDGQSPAWENATGQHRCCELSRDERLELDELRHANRYLTLENAMLKRRAALAERASKRGESGEGEDE